MAAGRLGGADAGDGNVNDFGGNDELQLRVEIGHFERRDEREAAGRLLRLRL